MGIHEESSTSYIVHVCARARARVCVCVCVCACVSWLLNNYTTIDYVSLPHSQRFSRISSASVSVIGCEKMSLRVTIPTQVPGSFANTTGSRWTLCWSIRPAATRICVSGQTTMVGVVMTSCIEATSGVSIIETTVKGAGEKRQEMQVHAHTFICICQFLTSIVAHSLLPNMSFIETIPTIFPVAGFVTGNPVWSFSRCNTSFTS